MKIVFLNTWNGAQAAPIRDFLAQQVPVTDIFCFQEAYDDFRSIAAEFLHDFTELKAYALAFNNAATGTEDFALATYVRKVHGISSSAIIKHEDRVRGLGLHVSITCESGPLHIINYHGVSLPKDKLDSPERLEQSRELIHYMADLNGPRILGGDFNILPNTEAYHSIAGAGYRELVLTSGIQATRNHLYWDRGPEKLAYSDYVFTSNDVEARDFEVPALEISDHLPLLLDANIRA